ncbi:conserved hypothetical protein [Synechococcus sp. PCC 7335]|uniref:DUF952 domain-containing protein n=1 Tax=Synechococcus sp. (strain ATCC 29403 / PCC 7335) TaxID=91464 RepID=UPI00017EB88F|nr:DUF952 domain-containing protein [Synechococcus sp. PCC 7335]EDX86664.1 conserved hypothetical protein [Synechococcus sp. PCC 7335]
MLFHIVESTNWAAAKERGMYEPDSLAAEGFIHLSKEQQVSGTVERFYKGRSDLVILEIDPKLLQASLCYDQVPGHGVFPHLYGPLNLEAVVRVWTIDSFFDSLNQHK